MGENKNPWKRSSTSARTKEYVNVPYVGQATGLSGGVSNISDVEYDDLVDVLEEGEGGEHQRDAEDSQGGTHE